MKDSTREEMAATLTIGGRFRGPPHSGNGGVSAGLAAALLEGPARVTLRRPPPLDTPLQVHWTAETVQVRDGDTLVMEARAQGHPVEIPIDGEALEATFRRGPTPIPPEHRAPDCFVCGPRPDGLRVCPANLPGTSVWSTVWTPDDSVAASGASVAEPVVWGALDCPAGFAVVQAGVSEPTFFPALTDLAATINERVPVGEPVAVFGWQISEDQRRANGGTALIDQQGIVLASAYAQHARLPLDFAEA